MAALSVNQINLTGVDLSAVDTAAAGGGDTFANDGRTMFYVDNQDASPITVTFDDTGSLDPGNATSFDPDVEVTVGATSDKLIGPFPVARFSDTVAVTYSAVTSVTVAAARL